MATERVLKRHRLCRWCGSRGGPHARSCTRPSRRLPGIHADDDAQSVIDCAGQRAFEAGVKIGVRHLTAAIQAHGGGAVCRECDPRWHTDKAAAEAAWGITDV